MVMSKKYYVRHNGWNSHSHKMFMKPEAMQLSFVVNRVEIFGSKF